MTAAEVTYLLLLGYVALAIVLFAASSGRLVSARLALLGHMVDLGVFTFLMITTDGQNSPFFLLFTFSVVTATFRWQWKGALATSAAVLVLFALVGLAHASLMPGEPLEVDRLVVRCAHLLVVGAMLACFGYWNERTTAELQRVSAWRSDPPGGDTEDVLARWMAHVAAVFGAERVIAVIDDPEEPWLTVASWSADGLSRQRLPSPSFEQLVAAPVAEAIFLREAADAAAIVLQPSGTLGSWRGAAVAPAFEAAFRLGPLISAPISDGHLRGRFFVVKPSRVSSEDLTIAGLVAEQIAAALDRLAASAALGRAVAADERLRLARDLHDGVLQTLAGTALQREEIANEARVDPRSAADRIRMLQRWLVGEQRGLRGFIRSLRPGGANIAMRAELERSLTALCESFETQWGLRCHLQVDPPQLEAPPLLGFHVHQIVREAAANAVRHGSATELEIAVGSSDDALTLSNGPLGSRSVRREPMRRSQDRPALAA